MKSARIPEQNKFTYKPVKATNQLVKKKKPKEIELTESELMCCLWATD